MPMLRDETPLPEMLTEEIEVNALRKERKFWLDQASDPTVHAEEAEYYMDKAMLCERHLTDYEVPFMSPDQAKINALRKQCEFWLNQVSDPIVPAVDAEYYMGKARLCAAQLKEYGEELRFLESLIAPTVQPSGALIVQPF